MSSEKRYSHAQSSKFEKQSKINVLDGVHYGIHKKQKYVKFQEKKVFDRKVFQDGNFENVQTHVKDFRRMLGLLYKQLRHYFICLTTPNDHISKTV